jgi:predicted O-linked N-acetylglucosamine transferase (SPINDLY family)
MDYILSDQNLIYNSEKHLYKEKIIFLPQIWNCHSGLDIKRSFNPSPFIKNKYITLGSFNNFSKINDEVVLTWSKILKSLKNTKLILKPSLTREIDFLADKFRQQNVLGSIEFVSSKKDFKDHMNLYKEIDIALDTFPYNGVTTSFEAIWMNVPVLTMKGYNFNSRCGESINKNLGLDHLIAQNEEDYVSKLYELDQNKDKLLNIRKLLFENAISSPLFNTKSFSKDFFNALDGTVNK